MIDRKNESENKFMHVIIADQKIYRHLLLLGGLQV